jgi:hypothetical protein
MKPDRAWVRLSSGRRLDLINPKPGDWTDLDLAVRLSRTYRWGGHSTWDLPLSVAQHSLLVLVLRQQMRPHQPLTLREALSVAVGNPVAPALMTQGIVEVNRLCIRRGLNPMLRWNCCSMLCAQSAREAERQGFNRIITYTRVDENGASLRAAGWACEGLAGGRGWHSSRRSRSNRNTWVKKLRWSRTLRPKPLPERRLPSAPSPGDDWSFRPATRGGTP